MAMETVEELKVAGNELFKAGKYAEAVEKYSDALAVEPENHLLHSNRSLAYCSAGDYNAAERDAKECIRLAPNFVKGYYRLANAQMQSGRYEEAAETLEKGLSIDPNNVELKKLVRIIKAKKAAPKKQEPLDDATKKEAQELSQQISTKRRELQETKAREQVSVRDVARLKLTLDQVQEVADDTQLYRAVGKAFLVETKPNVLQLLSTQVQTARDRATALEAHSRSLDREIDSSEADLRALVSKVS